MNYQARLPIDLEGEIANSMLRLCGLKDREKARQEWQHMSALIGMRSKEQVKTMEQSRGLTR